jgi:hypothetical protein
MLSQIINPNKSQLIRNIQSLNNPKISVHEIIDFKSKKDVVSVINNTSNSKIPFSVIIVRV